MKNIFDIQLKIRWWEAVLLFQVLLFLSGLFVTLYVNEIRETNFDLQNMLLYGQLPRTLYNHGKFLAITVIVFSAAYLRGQGTRFADIYTSAVLADLAYFAAKGLLALEITFRTRTYTEAEFKSAYDFTFSQLFGLPDTHTLFGLLNMISVWDIVHFFLFWWFLSTISTMTKANSIKLIATSYIPAYLFIILGRSLFLIL